MGDAEDREPDHPVAVEAPERQPRRAAERIRNPSPTPNMKENSP
jgi:hypothetical protein